MNQTFASRHPRIAEIIGIDLRTLALFRVCLGAVMLWTGIGRLEEAGIFWADWGVFPRSMAMQTGTLERISLYFINGSAAFTSMLLLLHVISAAMLMLGWRTRAAIFACFVLQVSLVNRNYSILVGGDLLLIALLFWSLFLPLSARCSVDAATAKNPPPLNSLHVSWASMAMLVQVMSVYFFSAILKSGDAWHPDYTAVYYTLSLDKVATPTGQLLLELPKLMQALSFLVFWLEALGPVLIFLGLRHLRLLLMAAFMLMHVGFIVCLTIGHFPCVSLASLTVFTGGWIWDRLRDRNLRKNLRPLTLYYDRDCGFCLKMCRLLQQFLVLPDIGIKPAQDTPRARTLLEANNSWVVIDSSDEAHLKWAAFVALIRCSPLLGWLWPLARAPFLEKPGNVAYDFVAKNRSRFANCTAALLPDRKIQWEVSRTWMRFAAVMMAAVFIWNTATTTESLARYIGQRDALKEFKYSVEEWIGAPLRALRMDQKWSMFAPYPSLDDGWLIIPGTLADGSEIDVLHPERESLSYAKPDNYATSHASNRWSNWHTNLVTKRYELNRLHYSKYLCRKWNADKLLDPEKRAKRLMSFKMVHMLERTLPDYQPPTVEQEILWRHECFPATSAASP